MKLAIIQIYVCQSSTIITQGKYVNKTEFSIIIHAKSNIL